MRVGSGTDREARYSSRSRRSKKQFYRKLQICRPATSELQEHLVESQVLRPGISSRSQPQTPMERPLLETDGSGGGCLSFVPQAEEQ